MNRGRKEDIGNLDIYKHTYSPLLRGAVIGALKAQAQNMRVVTKMKGRQIKHFNRGVDAGFQSGVDETRKELDTSNTYYYGEGLKTAYKNNHSYLLVEKDSKEPFTTFNDYSKELENVGSSFSKLIDKEMGVGATYNKNTRKEHLRQQGFNTHKSLTEGKTFKLYNNGAANFNDIDLSFYSDTKIPLPKNNQEFKDAKVPNNLYKTSTTIKGKKKITHK